MGSGPDKGRDIRLVLAPRRNEVSERADGGSEKQADDDGPTILRLVLAGRREEREDEG